jgi:hypothetical protein
VRAGADVYAIILLSTAITVSINIVEFVAFASLLLIMTAVMLRIYLPSATRIKKLRLDTAGSLVGLTAEVLEGLPLVQAYSKENHFVRVRCLLLLTVPAGSSACMYSLFCSCRRNFVRTASAPQLLGALLLAVGPVRAIVEQQ